MKRYCSTWVTCRGWGLNNPCTSNMLGKGVKILRTTHNKKRCLHCSKLQRRFVANASHRRNWPKYKEQRRQKNEIATTTQSPKRLELKFLAWQAGLLAQTEVL